MHDMNESSVMAVPAEVSKSAGAITYWRLSGAVPLQSLHDAWVAEGLDEALLPDATEPETALHRAVMEQAARRKLVRPLERRGSWIVVTEEIVGDRLQHRQDVRVRWDNARSAPVVEAIEADYLLLAQYEREIEDAYARARVELDPVDVSRWLTQLVGRQNAVGLREKGGLYFVPRTGMEFWRAVVRAIQTASNHRVFRIPAMQCDEAVEAILDAVTQEAKSAVADMEAELAGVADGSNPLGVRALKGRASSVEGLLGKLASYEQLLGARLPDVQAQLEGLQSSVSVAIMLAEAAKDKEKE